MINDPGRCPGSLTRDVRQRWTLDRLRINSLDHGKAIFADPGQNADGPQQSRCIIDQVEKGRHREQAEQRSHEEHQLVAGPLYPVVCGNRKQKGKNEQPDCVSDDVVPQQDGGNNTRCQLAAGHLNCNEQGSKCEDNKRQGHRDDGLEQGLRASGGKALELPAEPVIKHMQKAIRDLFKDYCGEWHNPQCLLPISPVSLQKVPKPHHFPSPRSSTGIASAQTPAR